MVAKAVEDLQHAIDWYCEAIPAASDRPYGPPPDAEAVESSISAISAAIAPLLIPEEIGWFWRHHDPYAFDAVPFPYLSAPDTVSQSLALNEEFGTFPRALLPVAYQSHVHLLVELGVPGPEPASIWTSAMDGEGIECLFPSLAALFRCCAELIEASGVEVPTDGRDRYAAHAEVLTDERVAAVAERYFAASVAPRAFGSDVRHWPAHWQVAEGLDGDYWQPRGRTHTVAEFERATHVGPVTGRLHGRWRTLGVIGADGIGVLADDTGSISMVRPAALPSGGRGDGSSEFEVDVAATGPAAPPPDLDTSAVAAAALAGDTDEASALAGELVGSMDEASARMPVITRMVPLAPS